jgi:ubiquinone/menaquinone biosynthesis C-methylase UbiE
MTLQQDAGKNESKFLHRYLDFADKRVLEIGCGEGRLTWQYAGETRWVTGVDLDMDALRVALIDRVSDLENTVSFACADSIHLPFRKEEFDLATFAWSF